MPGQSRSVADTGVAIPSGSPPTPSPRRPWWGPGGDTFSRALFVTLLVIFGILVIPPIWSLLTRGFTNRTGEFSLEHYESILPNLVRGDLLSNTFLFALSSAGIAFVLGSLLAWFAERTNAPFRKLAFVCAFMSFAFPTVIQTIGWIFLLGRQNGFLNDIFVNRLGILPEPFEIQSMAGMILVEAALWTPVVFLLMAVPFRSMDATLEEAGRAAGASAPQVFLRITLRLATPAGLAVLLISVVRNLEAFEVPAMLGIPGGINVMTTQIFIRLNGSFNPDYGQVSAYSTILILIVIPVLWGYYRATSGQGKYATITGKGMTSKPIDLARYRWLAGMFMLTLPAIVLGPVLLLLWGSFQSFYTAPSVAGLSTVTLENYTSLVGQNSRVVDSLINTLIVATISATVVVIITALAAWVIVRSGVRGRRTLDVLGILPLAVPGIVLGVGVLRTYVGIALPIYGTLAILVIAYMGRFIPYAMRFNFAGMLGISKDLEDNAYVAGASYPQVMRRILVPLLLPAMFTGWVYAFLLTSRELPVALILQGSDSKLVSVAIWDLWQTGHVTNAAALSVGVALALTAMGWLLQNLSDRFGVNPP